MAKTDSMQGLQCVPVLVNDAHVQQSILHEAEVVPLRPDRALRLQLQGQRGYLLSPGRQSTDLGSSIGMAAVTGIHAGAPWQVPRPTAYLGV